MFDRGQHGGRVVLGVIDHEVAAKTRGNDQGWEPCSGAPLIVGTSRSPLSGRRHVVPLTAELVVSGDDQGVLPAGTPLDALEQLDQVAAAAAFTGIARMLVLEPNRLDEADRIELAGLCRRCGQVHKGLLVLQMCPTRSSGGVVRVIVERLVMELEDLVGAVRPDRVRGGVRIAADARNRTVRPARPQVVAVRVRPAARVPGPADAGPG